MPRDWGPHFIVPSESLKNLNGRVLLRETYDENLLNEELSSMGLSGYQLKAVNPWYFRKKGTETWIKIGESSDKDRNFAVPWDTTDFENGEYEVLGLMHVWVKAQGKETIIARQNVVEVTVEN